MLQQEVWIIVGIAVLSFVSGMLGLGVTFAAIPFLGLFMSDLVHQVQPLSLTLNGVTALFATFGFAKMGYIDWRKAGGTCDCDHTECTGRLSARATCTANSHLVDLLRFSRLSDVSAIQACKERPTC